VALWRRKLAGESHARTLRAAGAIQHDPANPRSVHGCALGDALRKDALVATQPLCRAAADGSSSVTLPFHSTTVIRPRTPIGIHQNIRIALPAYRLQPPAVGLNDRPSTDPASGAMQQIAGHPSMLPVRGLLISRMKADVLGFDLLGTSDEKLGRR